MGLIISLLKIFFVCQSGKIITFSVKDFVLPLFILQYKTVPSLSSVISAKPRGTPAGGVCSRGVHTDIDILYTVLLFSLHYSEGDSRRAGLSVNQQTAFTRPSFPLPVSRRCNAALFLWLLFVCISCLHGFLICFVLYICLKHWFLARSYWGMRQALAPCENWVTVE